MARFAARLLAWFDRHRRDLPWRRTRDPWAIWVSEVMLQQTRVEAVREPYARFMARFPTPGSLAAASDDELLRAWKGLGYYRRARLLREGARAVQRDHAGAVPASPEQLGSLPGVGDYTRGAIASIAFACPEPAIDGNVERVFARHAGIADDIKAAASRRRLHALVMQHLDPARPGDFNQALMELGATICTPRNPQCGRCPVRADCVAARDGTAALLPKKKAPRQPVDVTARVLLVIEHGRALGHRVPDGEPNAGQVELPGPGMLKSCDVDDLGAAVRERFGTAARVGAIVGSARHAITHHRITVHAHAATVTTRGHLSWFAVHGETPWTTPCRKLFAKALQANT